MDAHHVGSSGIGEIGDRWRRIIADYGPKTILPYSYSGTLPACADGRQQRLLMESAGASQPRPDTSAARRPSAP